MKLCIFIAMTVFSYLGWWLGSLLGGGIMTSFWLSGLGTMIGIYLGWRIYRDYLS